MENNDNKLDILTKKKSRLKSAQARLSLWFYSFKGNKKQTFLACFFTVSIFVHYTLYKTGKTWYNLVNTKFEVRNGKINYKIKDAQNLGDFVSRNRRG